MKELTNTELQRVSLDILKEVHAYCETHHIRYSIAYGTLIGALRHKGFIPWDDDVDIVMPRPDFERFCQEFNSEHVRLIYYGNDKTALAAFARVVECEKTDYQTERPWTSQQSGVWIDIFPLDGVINQEEYSRRYEKMRLLSWFVYKFRRQNHHIVPSDSFWSKTKTVIAKIIGFNGWLPSVMLKRIIRIMTRYEYDTCTHYSQMSCLDDGPIVFDKDGFKDTVSVDFEDTKLYAMTGYDKVLRQVYGDYMQLPPEDKRAPKQYWIHFIWK